LLELEGHLHPSICGTSYLDLNLLLCEIAQVCVNNLASIMQIARVKYVFLRIIYMLGSFTC
jgi:hypothetical protein